MAQVLSLKELRTSSVLKAEISRLEEEKNQLLEQLERQKQLEKKLRDDMLEHKKDFEHLEKQFEHFAGIEAEFEALQQKIQLERLAKGKERSTSRIEQIIHSKQNVLRVFVIRACFQYKPAGRCPSSHPHARA